MALAPYVGLLHRAEDALASSFRVVGEGHAAEADVFHTCNTLAKTSDEHVESLRPIAERYGEDPAASPDRLDAEAITEARDGPLGLLRDLQDLYVLASLVDTCWTVVHQAAMGARDHELLQAVDQCDAGTKRQLSWLLTRLKQAAPQALLAS